MEDWIWVAIIAALFVAAFFFVRWLDTFNKYLDDDPYYPTVAEEEGLKAVQRELAKRPAKQPAKPVKKIVKRKPKGKKK